MLSYGSVLSFVSSHAKPAAMLTFLDMRKNEFFWLKEKEVTKYSLLPDLKKAKKAPMSQWYHCSPALSISKQDSKSSLTVL